MALVVAIAVFAPGSGDAAAQPQAEDVSSSSTAEDPTPPDEGLLPDTLDPEMSPSDSGQTYPNLGSQLSALAVAADIRQYGAEGGGPPNTDMTEGAGPPTPPGGTNSTLNSSEPRLLTIQLDGNQDEVVEFLAEHGITPANALSNYLEVELPPGLLASLAEQTGVARVREMPTPRRLLDNVFTKGVPVHQAGRWHAAGYEGQGVKIGVIDAVSRPKDRNGVRRWGADGFTGLRALMGVGLPRTVKGLCFPGPGSATFDLADCDRPGGVQHGTRVAETVMDMAPRASLYISNASTWADLQRAVEWMHAQGVKVIVYSIGWTFHGAADGTSPLTPSPLNTVKWATDNGIVWVNAAGNGARHGWYGSFKDTDMNGYHEWGPRNAVRDETQARWFASPVRMTIFLRWDDTWGGAAKDLDLGLLYRPDSQNDFRVVAASADGQGGGSTDYPYEAIVDYEGPAGEYAVFVTKKDASAAPSWLQLGTWGWRPLEYHTTHHSIMTPADSASPGMLAVGAMELRNAPTFGSFHLATYSSRGPTPDGRMKPDLVALGCGSVSLGPYGSRPFCGTSAAAPHLGGLAALVLQRNPAFTPIQVADYLKANAADHGAEGPDNEWGHGFARLPGTGLPEVGCVTDLTGEGTVQGRWYGVCPSTNVGAHSHFYNFSLDEQRQVTIDLDAPIRDTYLYLRSGRGQRTGPWLHSDDNSGHIRDARISQSLPTGDYTIEATTRQNGRTGPFTLTTTGVQNAAPAQQGPEVSITAGSAVTEGAGAVFTVSSDPAPAAPLTVSLTVSQRGDYAATGAVGAKTVTIPTSGAVQHSVATADDSTGEADGSISAMINPGQGYVVSPTHGAARVAVSDNEPVVSITAGDAINEGGDAVFTVSSDPAPTAPMRVSLMVFQRGDYAAAGTMGAQTVTIPASGAVQHSVATIDDSVGEDRGVISAMLSTGQVYSVSATHGAASVAVADDDRPPPVVSVTAGPGVTEGGSASFTFTATPAPSTPLPVGVAVTTTGSYGVATGSMAVTIPASGSVTQGIATVGDDVEEPDGWVTVTLNAGIGYTVSSSRGAASVAVADDDRPPPVVSVTAGPGVTEGGSASFTFIATPSPSAPLTVSLTVVQTGSYGVATGGQTVTVPIGGVVSHTVATVDDSADEPDGSVTVTLNAGSGYTVSSSQGAATVAVADNDTSGPEVGVTAVAVSLTEGDDARFTVTASPAPSSPLTVSLQVLQIGDHLAPGAAGVQQVTIPVSGSAQHSVATDDDAVAERNGMIIVMVARDSGYTVSRSRISAGAVVYDNDARSRTPTPRISVTAGAGITEGGSAGFTVTADPAPGAPLTVRVAVGQTGDYAAPGTTGSKTVIIPTSGSASHTVATTDDAADEEDGAVTLTVNTGSGYTVSPSQGAASVTVSDDDDPTPTPTPEISVLAGSGITEGGNASFTVTAAPVPSAPLAVSVTVTQRGDYGVSTGSKTVMVPTGGSAQY
ncbi:MAG: S8 family serine peptidase, partial [bacterium]|nr:S8 family serine peptidase [bacterium]